MNIVGCSDSRVPVELIFDQGIGDIFVIRTAGNNVNSEMVMGSVDYAIEHLGVKLLLEELLSCRRYRLFRILRKSAKKMYI